jgi:hypothetical protein
MLSDELDRLAAAERWLRCLADTPDVP